MTTVTEPVVEPQQQPTAPQQEPTGKKPFPKTLTLADGTVLNVDNYPLLKEFSDATIQAAESRFKAKYFPQLETEKQKVTSLTNDLTKANTDMQTIATYLQQQQQISAQEQQQNADYQRQMQEIKKFNEQTNNNPAFNYDAFGQVVSTIFDKKIADVLPGLQERTAKLENAALTDYRTRRLTELGDTVFPELVRGNTPEELEASIEQSKALRAKYMPAQQPTQNVPTGTEQQQQQSTNEQNPNGMYPQYDPNQQYPLNNGVPVQQPQFQNVQQPQQFQIPNPAQPQYPAQPQQQPGAYPQQQQPNGYPQNTQYTQPQPQAQPGIGAPAVNPNGYYPQQAQPQQPYNNGYPAQPQAGGYPQQQQPQPVRPSVPPVFGSVPTPGRQPLPDIRSMTPEQFAANRENLLGMLGNMYGNVPMGQGY